MQDIQLDTPAGRVYAYNADACLPVELVYSDPSPPRPQYGVHAIPVHARDPEPPESAHEYTSRIPMTRVHIAIGVATGISLLCAIATLTLVVIGETRLVSTEADAHWIASQLPVLYTQISYTRDAMDRTTNAMTMQAFEYQDVIEATAQQRAYAQAQLSAVQNNMTTVTNALVQLIGVLRMYAPG